MYPPACRRQGRVHSTPTGWPCRDLERPLEVDWPRALTALGLTLILGGSSSAALSEGKPFLAGALFAFAVIVGGQLLNAALTLLRDRMGWTK